MKLPKIPTRTPKAPSEGSQPGFQPPRLLSDIFKDMRDRRLVIPAVALLVAIVAVPLVLSASPEPAVPPAPLASDSQAAAVEPAVLALQETGVRDFRERLDALDSKNPFGDRFEVNAALGGEASESQLVAPDEPVEPSASPVAPEATSAPDSSGGSAGVAPGQAAPPPTASPQSEPFVLASRIDVEVGIVDRERRQSVKSVKSGDLLPSKETPVLMFLGNGSDASNANFLVSRDVSRVNGEGRCKPDKDNCEFLRLEDGDSAYLRYADGNRYVITLKDIYFERVPESKADGG